MGHVGGAVIDHEMAIGYQVGGPSPAALQRRKHIVIAVQYQRGHRDFAEFGREIG